MPRIVRNLDTKLVFVPHFLLLGEQGVDSGDDFSIPMDEILVLHSPFPLICLGKLVVMGLSHH